ncbi:transposase [Kribbella sp. VKM Ac-2568]|uniref:transposase n=1 Tax=Kribbella sp. VKM Ac-2568 TaxID=2512219 RepID=UPI00351A4F96
MDVVAMDGFTGFKTAAAEELPDAVAVMDPFHVVRLAGDALDECRRVPTTSPAGHPRPPGPQTRPALLRSADPAHQRRPTHQQAGSTADRPVRDR